MQNRNLIVCAGKQESFELCVSIGIGLMQSAINLTRICCEKRFDELIFIGTAGSYGDLKIGDIVECSKSANIEIGYFDKLSYTPLKNLNVSRETSHDLVVNCSNFITQDEKIAKQMLLNGFDLENMEFFAVQNVARSFGIKSRGIFYITNYCDKNAHEEFIKNHKTAKEKLNQYIKNFT